MMMTVQHSFRGEKTQRSVYRYRNAIGKSECLPVAPSVWLSATCDINLLIESQQGLQK